MTSLSAARQNNKGGQDAGGQDTDGPWISRNRRILLGIFFAALVLQPFQIVLHGPHSDLEWLQLTGAVVLAGIVIWHFSSVDAGDRRSASAALAARSRPAPPAGTVSCFGSPSR